METHGRPYGSRETRDFTDLKTRRCCNRRHERECSRDGSKGCLSIRMTSELGDNAMYVGRLFPALREKLVTMKDDALLTEAANCPHKGTDLLILCCSAGPVAGGVTNTDVVGQSRCQGASCTMAVSLATTRDVMACWPGDLGRLKSNERAEFETHPYHGPGLSTRRSTACASHSTRSSGGLSKRGIDVARLCYGHRLRI
jgi:hypothetical protein